MNAYGPERHAAKLDFWLKSYRYTCKDDSKPKSSATTDFC
jgi:hypothetical protein